VADEHYDPDTFRGRFGPWALVAGASDGIGESFARQLAGRGLDIVLLARREERLEKLSAEIRAEHGVEARVAVADLTGDDLDQRIAKATDGLEIGLLVYNAGAVHGASEFHDQSVEHALSLVKLNCRGPVLLTHRLGGLMRERGRGGILLLTSMAALCGSAYTASYNATKSFDLILAESLWHELTPRGVDVMAVIAGATRTPSMLSSNPSFENYPGIMSPDDVAAGALANLGRGPSWVAGQENRERERLLSQVPRTILINAMSEATAQLYDLPFERVEGTDRGDLS
jgi:short-subunit dehydrogenase